FGVAHAPHAISTDGRYVTIDAIAADGNGAALLAQLQAIGLEHGASFKSMASGLLPIDKVGALLGLSDLAHASESGMSWAKSEPIGDSSPLPAFSGTTPPTCCCATPTPAGLRSTTSATTTSRVPPSSARWAWTGRSWVSAISRASAKPT